MLNGFGGFDELLGPCRRLVLLDQGPEESRVYGDGGGGVEVTAVGGPPERGAKVRKLAGEPVVGLALPRTVPQRDHIGFAVREVSRVRIACLLGQAIGGELIFGELADGLQHREPGSPRRPVGNQKRLAHQGIEQVQGGELFLGAGHRTRARQVEAAREDRAPVEQRLLVLDRAGRRTTAPRDAASDGVPARGATRPAAGTGR